MKHKQPYTPLTHSFAVNRRSFLMTTRLVLLVGILLVNSVSVLVRPALAAGQTADQYCSQYVALPGSDYETSTLRNACKAGVNDTEDCNDYGLTADQFVVDICKKAATDRANGLVQKGEFTVTPDTPTPEEEEDPSDSESGGNDINDLLNQAESLSDYIDILHQAGPDADVDTEEVADGKGFYINGAGGKQKLDVIKEGTGQSPVILFINGGGWHANDCMGQRVMAGGGRDCADVGGDAEKAGDRGYAAIDLTYRLGSSSVYYAFEDVMRGIQSVAKNAELYGIDPNKIVIWGDSAGGSLSMRASASGKSGAKAAVGWSAPTNGYTAVFKSFQAFGVGVDHSTCAPTDLAGLANFADLANGGSGDVAEYGTGLSSNDPSALGIGLDGASTGGTNPLTLLTQGLVAGGNLLSAAKDVEEISNKIKEGGIEGMSGSVTNMLSKKMIECLDNFNTLSPALFASPDSAPSFLAGFEDDGLIDPSQSYGMRDKLRQLGIKSDALILPGGGDCMEVAAAPAGAGGCHLGYYKGFVCDTLNFVDSIVQPDRGKTDCGTGVAENQGSNDGAVAAGGSGGGGSGSGSGGSGSGSGGSSNSNSNGSTTKKAGDSCTTSDGKAGILKNRTGAPGLVCSSAIDDQKAACTAKGLTWTTLAKGGGYCNRPSASETQAGYYSAVYVKQGDSGRYTCPKGGTFTQDRSKGNICKL